MCDKLNICYIGSNYKTAEQLILSNWFNLKFLICEADRINKNMILFSNVYSIPMYTVSSKDELLSVIKKVKSQNTDLCLMQNFGIIIPKSILQIMDVYNIHLGNLNKYRGRNPIESALLNNEKNIHVTLHKVSEKIDLGEVIYELKLHVLLYDDGITIEDRVNNSIHILIDKLKEYLNGNLKSYNINEGTYRPKILQEDFVINIDTDDIKTIYNKIQSQKKYKGAIINIEGKKYFIKDITQIWCKDYFNRSVYFDKGLMYIQIDNYLMKVDFCI